MIPIQQVIREIEESGVTGSAFKIRFVKSDGSIREMIAVKRNKLKDQAGQSKEKSKFNYNLKEKHSLLINEVTTYKTRQVNTGIGTVHELIHAPGNLQNVMLSSSEQHKLSPKTIKLYSILAFNDQKVYA